MIIALSQKGDNDAAQEYAQKYLTLLEELNERLHYDVIGSMEHADDYLHFDTDSD